MGGGDGVGGGGSRGGGREGDWECSSCRNRNYAFRCFCNRCKQPRLLVDTKTPPDSKWLPRIGDWICSGCTNNNYASREKCKKCGQAKEIAAMPAISIPGVSLPPHVNYSSRPLGLEEKMNLGLLHDGAFGHSLQHSIPRPLSSNWSLGRVNSSGSQPAEFYKIQAAPAWPLTGTGSSFGPYSGHADELSAVPIGWRSGDWICACGFHNYASRSECKKCNAAMPAPVSTPLVSTGIAALGTKRVASEELAHDWDNKRLNAGHTFELQQAYGRLESLGAPGCSRQGVFYSALPTGDSVLFSGSPVNLLKPHVPVAATLLGKGSNQWRDGDWMCKNCNNHNYASRTQCNRCKTEREASSGQVSNVDVTS